MVLRLQPRSVEQVPVFYALLAKHRWWRVAALVDAGQEGSAIVRQLNVTLNVHDRTPWDFTNVLQLTNSIEDKMLDTFILKLKWSGVQAVLLISENKTIAMRAFASAKKHNFASAWIISGGAIPHNVIDWNVFPARIVRISYAISSSSTAEWLDAVHIMADALRNMERDSQEVTSRRPTRNGCSGNFYSRQTKNTDNIIYR